MHPLWAEGEDLAPFLEPLQAAGLTALEFTLHATDRHWPRFEPQIAACAELGLTLCFHAPYLPPYTLVGFSEDQEAAIRADYEPMLDLAARYGPTAVVVHGPGSETRSREALVADTVAFFQWAVPHYPQLTFTLENLVYKPKLDRIGEDRAEMLQIAHEVDHERFGFCWDMGHDIMDERPVSGLTPEWIGLVRHVHVHDVNRENHDHYPLVHGRVPYNEWLTALLATGFEGIVSLEIKGHQLAHLGRDRVRELLRLSVERVVQALEA
jgi:sugar phosphate isomerase/epimerase